jgi:hypothetical protein
MPDPVSVKDSTIQPYLIDIEILRRIILRYNAESVVLSSFPSRPS